MIGLQPAFFTPRLVDVIKLPTAADVTLRSGDPVWYCQIDKARHSVPVIVAGVFSRYGTLRCAIVVTDAGGAVRRLWVGTHRVHVEPWTTLEASRNGS
jgi:hypothetical protein